jgi:ethanolamine utilization protein EutN
VIIGTVVGSLWATIKDPSLEGLRFLVIRPLDAAGKGTAETVVAADPLGAGIGERVLVAYGRAARHAIGRGHDIGFQSAVVGIVDRCELQDRTIHSHEDDDTV